MVNEDILKKKKRRTAGKVLFIAAALLIVLACAACGVYKSSIDPYRHMTRVIVPTKPLEETMTAERTAEDMKYVYDRVSETHPIWVDGSDELVTAFDEAYAKQCEYLASKGDGVTVLDEWRAVSAMLAVLGDAHTMSNVRPERRSEQQIVRTDELSDSAVLVGVQGRSADTLYSSFKTMCPYESEVWALSRFNEAVADESWLMALGIDTSGEIVYEYADGKTIKQRTCRFVVPGNEDAVSGTDGGSTEEDTGFCGYYIDLERGIGVFTLKECIYNEKYRDILSRFFEDVRTNDIGDVIVDLRDNTGGNSQVANEFIGYLDTESFVAFGGVDVRMGSRLLRNEAVRSTVVPKKNTFSGDVYILTSAKTFSSAVDFAVMIADNGLGTIVGEVPGGMPGSYGDIVVFQTKNAGVLFQVSYKYFHRIDGSKDDQPLVPDIECDAREAYDTALERIAAKAA